MNEHVEVNPSHIRQCLRGMKRETRVYQDVQTETQNIRFLAKRCFCKDTHRKHPASESVGLRKIRKQYLTQIESVCYSFLLEAISVRLLD